MGFKELIQKMKNNSKEKKERLNAMLEQDRMERIVMERRKSSNQRELEGYVKENYEKKIKEQLDYMRKARSNDIRFNHNPLNVKNITNSTQWEVLKEKNMFKGRSNMFVGHDNIHKSNKNLLKSGNVLKGRSKLFQSQGGFK